MTNTVVTSTLTDSSNNWWTRPDDERFTSLVDMADYANRNRKRSKQINLDTSTLSVVPVEPENPDSKGMKLRDSNGRLADLTNYSFGQLAAKIPAPKLYLSSLPAPLAAQAINYGLSHAQHDDVGVLMSRIDEDNEIPHLQARAFTSPKYGRVWNADLLNALVSRFGDGVGTDSDWRVPGEFGKEVVVTKANTTLFQSDRDMHVFLADEKNRIELPNRRDGKSGSLARGFFVSNSETGYATLSVKFFLFDYVCSNRIVWGATDVKEITMRHSLNAPERFADEIAPVLAAYSKSASVKSLEQLRLAQSTVIDSDHGKVLEFISDKFGNMTLAKAIDKAHKVEEDRPISTIWDAVTGATAYAKSINFQDERVEIEKKAGKLLNLVAA